MFELTTSDWIGITICALFVGISKTGIPGLGILIVPILASIIPARTSVGVLLPMLIVGDVFAVLYYRRHAVWRHLFPLFPWVFAGIVAGYFALGHVNNEQLQPIIGCTVIFMLLLGVWQRRKNDESLPIPNQWWFAAIIGLLAGTATMIANVAGPIMIIYFLAMRLPKHEFIGTGAWFYLIFNCIKIPFHLNLGTINLHTLSINLVMIPCIAVGALCGIFILKRIPQRAFNVAVQVLACVAAIKLLF